jgi:ParB-like chromosome segregation protein Spo0J
MKYEAHPLAAVFPMMDEDAFQAFKEDIRVNGVHEWGTLYEGKILDGRNRYRACCELGIEMTFGEVESCEPEYIAKFDPVAFVISHNLHRRHLSESQRAMVAAKLADMTQGRPSKEKGPNGTLIEDASKMLNVSERSTKRAKKVLSSGSEEVQQAVEIGELPVSVAADFVKKVPDKQEQAAIASQGAEAVKEKVKQANAKFDRAVKSVTQKCENEVNEFLLFWEQRSAKGKKAIWLWLVDNYDNG